MRFVVRRTSVPLSSGLPEWFTWDYDRVEILVDAIVHACGLAGGIVGATVLTALVSQSGLSLRSASVLVYATGLLAMLSPSTAYNLWPVSPVKWILRRFDHSTIYLFIAATYTPFLTHSAPSEIPVVTLAAVWVLAIVGAVLKMLLPGRLERLSIGFYFLVGWTGLAAYRYEMALPPDALQLIALGGLLYSAGVIVHLWHSLRFQNAIWHGMVFLAASCHYAAVLLCVQAA
jgi:hemolysin III